MTVAEPAPAAGTATAEPAAAETRVRIRRITPEGALTAAGAAGGALGLVWVLYERVLPFTGVLGFWVGWYVTFLLIYAAMAWLQWKPREVRDRVATVVFGTAGLFAVFIVLDTVGYTLVHGLRVVRHLNTFTQSMAFAGPLSPLTVGGVAHAIIGTLEQIIGGTAFAVPLGLAAALFLAEVGGPLARPVRTIVEAMTALPDIFAGLFIYALVILTLGVQKSGFAASLALAVTMMPIVARAAEVVIRLVPGALREASYALGASQWRTVLNVVLPTARAGLSTAVVLAMARGIGETAPVLFTAGFTKEMNWNWLSGPQVNLPLYIWNYAHVEATSNTGNYIQRGFGAAFTLVAVVLLLFALARRLGGAEPGELTRRQRRRLAQQAAQAAALPEAGS
jgi:phosphate transport system permease protein